MSYPIHSNILNDIISYMRSNIQYDIINMIAYSFQYPKLYHRYHIQCISRYLWLDTHAYNNAWGHSIGWVKMFRLTSSSPFIGNWSRKGSPLCRAPHWSARIHAGRYIHLFNSSNSSFLHSGNKNDILTLDLNSFNDILTLDLNSFNDILTLSLNSFSDILTLSLNSFKDILTLS